MLIMVVKTSSMGVTAGRHQLVNYLQAALKKRTILIIHGTHISQTLFLQYFQSYPR